ncbi:MAG: hypothetical protein LBW85_10060 [Deltaproteobacteria bacterium]|jgi:hypothetical protein|nr:hypothetical protein [Deltaproteobacteria bacterium]
MSDGSAFRFCGKLAGKTREAVGAAAGNKVLAALAAAESLIDALSSVSGYLSEKERTEIIKSATERAKTRLDRHVKESEEAADKAVEAANGISEERLRGLKLKFKRKEEEVRRAMERTHREFFTELAYEKEREEMLGEIRSDCAKIIDMTAASIENLSAKPRKDYRVIADMNELLRMFTARYAGLTKS